MSKMKAVVLEKSGSRYTVLGQDGTFRHVHRRLNAEVGEEVQIQLWTESFSGVRIWAGAVALFLLVLTTLLGWNLYQAPTAVALLSVDINPSIQFALDNQGRLLKIQTQNEDAKRMLSQLELKGKPIEEVLEQIVTQAYDHKFLSSEQQWVVVGYSPMNNKTLEQMPKELNENQIISWVTEIGEKKGLTPQVAVFALTSQERESAQKKDLTLGEYALWQTADKAGVVTQPERLKDTSERVRLLENPQIQVLIKAEKNEQQSKSRSQEVERNQQKDQNIDNTKVNTSTSTDTKASIGNNANSRANTNNNAKANDEDKQKTKDQEKYQNKDQNKPRNSENKALQQSKYDNIYVPSIPTQGKFSHDTFRTYKFPEYDRDKGN